MSTLRAYGWSCASSCAETHVDRDSARRRCTQSRSCSRSRLKKHAGIPPDIPLAKQVTNSSVVLPLALLAFATFFGAPIIPRSSPATSSSSEDANNTLKMILTRSTGRGAIYAAKALAAATYGIALMVVLFAVRGRAAIASGA